MITTQGVQPNTILVAQAGGVVTFNEQANE